MITNIRVFFKITYLFFSTIVLKQKHGVFHKSCELCGGMTHTKLQSEHNDGVYTVKFQCKKCGAIGELAEKWTA